MIEEKKPTEGINQTTQTSNSPSEGNQTIIEDMPNKSRLSKKAAMKSKQNLILSILGIALILFLLIRYGLPLMSDASFFVGKITGGNSKEEENKENADAPVPSPDLDPTSKATKEANITISGTSLSGLKVALYLNGSKEGEKEVSEDGTFEFEVQLSEGDNIIRARAIRGEKQSEFSNTLNIAYKKEGPELTIDFPSNNAELKGPNPFEVRGKTNPDSKVTVNDFQAVINSDGSYSYFLTLKGGGNDIKVVSEDLAGNKTEKTIHVNYSQ